MTGITAQPATSGLQVVHAMPGRVRLRGADGENQLNTVAEKLRQQAGVCNVEANLESGSLIVTFDETALSYSQMFKLLRQSGVSTTPETKVEAQTDSFWLDATQLESVIPLIAGALITGGLGIQGLPAIPVYLLAAGTTRQLIEQLEDEKEAPSVETSTDHAPITYSIVHAVPGRVRFALPRLGWDEIYARRLEKLAAADNRILGVRVNRAAASVVFSYDKKAGGDAGMRQLFIQLLYKAAAPFTPPAFSASPVRVVEETGNKKSAASRNRKETNYIASTRESAAVAVCQKTTYLTGLKPPALTLILNFMTHLY
jgi:hypothetical protein